MSVAFADIVQRAVIFAEFDTSFVCCRMGDLFGRIVFDRRDENFAAYGECDLFPVRRDGTL